MLARSNESVLPPQRSVLFRTVQLIGGLLAYAISAVLMIRGGLGLGPWDAFHVGVSRLTGMSVGIASIAVGLAIVLGNYVLRIKPGPATIANMILIGVFIDLILPLVPAPTGIAYALIYQTVGICLVGLATGMYLGARLGAGPRDGLMTALSARWGWSIRRTRTLIEVTALALGWAMGGTVGVGTIMFTLAVGPAAQLGMRMFGLLGPNARGRIEGGEPAVVAS
jgi:uncharacterized membrane protein YczE